MMKNIVQESDAVAILPLNFLLADLETKTIAVLPVELPMLKGELGIVRLARRSLSPLGELFVRRVLEVDTEVAVTEEKAAKRLFSAQRRSTRSAHPSIPRQ